MAQTFLREKSRSTVSWPIFSYKGASWASTVVVSVIPPLLRANKDAVPSGNTFFQAWIMLACTPNRLESSATVPSCRIAANATFALNAAPCFLRVFAIRYPWPNGRFRGETLAEPLSRSGGPPYPVAGHAVIRKTPDSRIR